VRNAAKRHAAASYELSSRVFRREAARGSCGVAGERAKALILLSAGFYSSRWRGGLYPTSESKQELFLQAIWR